ESLHVVERVEEQDRLELGVAGAVAAEDERAARAGKVAGAFHAVVHEIPGVLVTVLRERRPAPDARDHEPSRYEVSQPAGAKAWPSAAAAIERMTVPSSSASATRSAFGSLTYTSVFVGASISSVPTVNVARPLMTM